MRSGWCLADGVLTATDIAQLHPPPRLVFSNSCEAAAGGPWDGRYEGQVFGLGSAFLLAGVANYVGTFWVVHDTESLDFATACYRRLAAGGRLGDALQAARTAVAATHGAQAITWASYVHYGDPGYRPFPLGVDAQPSVPRATRNARAGPLHRVSGRCVRYAHGGPGRRGPAPRRPHRRADAVGRRARRRPRRHRAGGRPERAAGNRQDGAARRRFSPGCGTPTTCGSRRAMPSSSTAPARRTCRSSPRSGAWGATRAGARLVEAMRRVRAQLARPAPAAGGRRASSDAGGGGAGRDARAHAARAGRALRSRDGGAPARPRARGPALERPLDDRGDRVPRAGAAGRRACCCSGPTGRQR